MERRWDSKRSGAVGLDRVPSFEWFGSLTRQAHGEVEIDRLFAHQGHLSMVDAFMDVTQHGPAVERPRRPPQRGRGSGTARSPLYFAQSNLARRTQRFQFLPAALKVAVSVSSECKT